MSDAHGHAADHSHADIDRHVKSAILVFASLLVLTGVTVGAYFLHLPTRVAIALALTIAVVKGSLVAAWFMHLISEKKIIYWFLGLTIAFFLSLLLLPTLTASGAVQLQP
jgi:cytochrome c oxidase subunit 4